MTLYVYLGSFSFNMSVKPYVILGEAQESESEEEIDFSSVSKDQVKHFKGKVVTGEAPESDEESRENQSRLNYVTDAITILPSPSPKKKSTKHRSILVKKLCERNTSLHKNLHEFINQTAANAGNELNITNQRLLKCQVQMQEGAEFFKVLNLNLSSLGAKLESLLALNYLPKIKINDNDQNPS